MSAGLKPFFFGQVPIADRGDDGPVASDRAALKAGDSEVDRLELHTWNPKSREEVPLSAADHDITRRPCNRGGELPRCRRQRGDGHVQLLELPAPIH
jgi:hypothetical protein